MKLTSIPRVGQPRTPWVNRHKPHSVHGVEYLEWTSGVPVWNLASPHGWYTADATRVSRARKLSSVTLWDTECICWNIAKELLGDTVAYLMWAGLGTWYGNRIELFEYTIYLPAWEISEEKLRSDERMERNGLKIIITCIVYPSIVRLSEGQLPDNTVVPNHD